MDNIDPRIIEHFNKQAPFKLEDATLLVLALVGSDSHGTYIPPTDPQAIDDTDYMGIVIPPPSYTFGIKDWDNLTIKYEELDCVFYSFRKFINLLIKSNPNVLGLMWLKPEHYIYQNQHLWQWMIRSRGLFSSRLAYPSFIGYATAQLRKMTSFDIDTQNEWDDAVELITAAGWTVNQITNKESRGMPDLGAIKQTLIKRYAHIDAFRDVDWDNEIFVESRERAVQSILKIHAKHFQGYMGEKRKNLVRKYGYDTKNAAHLIRLLRMCVEYLETGELHVFRTVDAYHLMEMKSGKFPLEDVKAEAEELFKRAEALKDINVLPIEPDYEAIDNLVKQMHISAYGLTYPATA